MSDETEPQPGMPVGTYRPSRIAAVDSPSPDADLIRRLRDLTGLSAAFSDELDRLGYATAVPASVLRPLRPGDVVVGRALTLRYVSSRRQPAPARLAHATTWEQGRTGDVLVIQAPDIEASVLGGLAAEAAQRAGVAAVVADGAVRDLDEIDACGLPVWSRGYTPVTGRNRLAAVEINGSIQVGGAAVEPGDIVVADRSGVVFVPIEVFGEVADRVLAAAG